jgi:hypothetical protein
MLIFSSARSVAGSRPTIVACTVRPPLPFSSAPKCTSTLVASSMTWLLVRMKPSGEMMKPDPPLVWRCSSSSGSRGRRGSVGSGKKNSKGSMPKLRRRCSLARTISVERMETTAGMTRAATSANEGMVTDGTAPGVEGVETDCAFEVRISPRSALMRIPNATDAMTIAIVERMRLVDAFIDLM